MFIKSIHLKNFQAHEDREVEFSRGITTIRGATDVGKSAIVRALNWVLLNNIPGGDFVRHGAKSAEVTVTVAKDGKWRTITRRRSASGAVNTYELDGKEFKAFGTGVPDEIKAVLDLNEINFQNQHDSTFWFSDSAGEVSRKLNAIIDLSVIDTALYEIGARVRTCQERQKISSEKIEETKFDLERLEGQQDRIKEFAELSKEKIRIENRTEAIERLWKAVQSVTSRTTELADAVEYRNDVAKMEEIAARCLQLSNKSTKLALILIDANREKDAAEREIGDFTPLAKMFAQLRTEAPIKDRLAALIKSIKENKPTEVPSFAHVEETHRAMEAQQRKIEDLVDAMSRVKERHFAADALAAAAVHAEDKFHKAIKGSVCPLCQHPL